MDPFRKKLIPWRQPGTSMFSSCIQMRGCNDWMMPLHMFEAVPSQTRLLNIAKNIQFIVSIPMYCDMQLYQLVELHLYLAHDITSLMLPSLQGGSPPSDVNAGFSPWKLYYITIILNPIVTLELYYAQTSPSRPGAPPCTIRHSHRPGARNYVPRRLVGTRPRWCRTMLIGAAHGDDH